MSDSNKRAEFEAFIESFSNIRTFHIEMNEILKHWNSTTFRERTKLTAMTYSNLTTKPGHRFDKNSIITMCIAAKVNMAVMERMLKLQGHSLSDSPDQRMDMAIRFLYEEGYVKQGIKVCNDVLDDLGISTLLGAKALEAKPK